MHSSAGKHGDCTGQRVTQVPALGTDSVQSPAAVSVDSEGRSELQQGIGLTLEIFPFFQQLGFVGTLARVPFYNFLNSLRQAQKHVDDTGDFFVFHL